MKKQLLAAAALALVSGVAAAQSATVYGILDTSIFTSNNSSSTGQSVTRMTSGQWLPSLFGIKGSEDLGGGLKANFNLEGDLDSTAGAGGNSAALFNRNATVGFSGNFGKIDLGHQIDNFFLQGVANSIVFMHADTLALNGLTGYARSNANSNTNGAFNNNMVAYETPSFGGVKVKAQYTITGKSGDNSSASMSNAIATYSMNGLSLVAGYEQVKGALGSTTGALDAGSAAGTENKTMLAAKYSVGQIDLAAQYQRYSQTGYVNVDAYEVGAGYHVTPQVLLAVNYEYFDDKQNNTKPQIISVKGKYDLSKRTAIYGIVANYNAAASQQIDQGYVATVNTATASMANKTSTNFTVGVTHLF